MWREGRGSLYFFLRIYAHGSAGECPKLPFLIRATAPSPDPTPTSYTVKRLARLWPLNRLGIRSYNVGPYVNDNVAVKPLKRYCLKQYNRMCTCAQHSSICTLLCDLLLLPSHQRNGEADCCFRFCSSVCVRLFPYTNWKLLIRNWCNLAEICFSWYRVHAIRFGNIWPWPVTLIATRRIFVLSGQKNCQQFVKYSSDFNAILHGNVSINQTKVGIFNPGIWPWELKLMAAHKAGASLGLFHIFCCFCLHLHQCLWTQRQQRDDVLCSQRPVILEPLLEWMMLRIPAGRAAAVWAVTLLLEQLCLAPSQCIPTHVRCRVSPELWQRKMALLSSTRSTDESWDDRRISAQPTASHTTQQLLWTVQHVF